MTLHCFANAASTARASYQFGGCNLRSLTKLDRKRSCFSPWNLTSANLISVTETVRLDLVSFDRSIFSYLVTRILRSDKVESMGLGR